MIGCEFDKKFNTIDSQLIQRRAVKGSTSIFVLEKDEHTQEQTIINAAHLLQKILQEAHHQLVLTPNNLLRIQDEEIHPRILFV